MIAGRIALGEKLVIYLIIVMTRSSLFKGINTWKRFLDMTEETVDRLVSTFFFVSRSFLSCLEVFCAPLFNVLVF